jgi:hypothetical protein
MRKSKKAPIVEFEPTPPDPLRWQSGAFDRSANVREGRGSAIITSISVSRVGSTTLEFIIKPKKRRRVTLETTLRRPPYIYVLDDFNL